MPWQNKAISYFQKIRTNCQTPIISPYICLHLKTVTYCIGLLPVLFYRTQLIPSFALFDFLQQQLQCLQSKASYNVTLLEMPEHYSPRACLFAGAPHYSYSLNRIWFSIFFNLWPPSPKKKQNSSPVYYHNIQWSCNGFTWLWLACAETPRYLWHRFASV